MTPPARAAAAIQILDEILSGVVAEKALAGWARRSRYAGSGDRAAIRDLIFTCLRQRRSLSALGGDEGGRGLLLGLMKSQGQTVSSVFTGEKYAPLAQTPTEAAYLCDLSGLPTAVRFDCPDWAEPLLQKALSEDYAPIMTAMQDRAALFLRVNQQKSNLHDAAEMLAGDQIPTHPHSLAHWALEVTDNPRKIAHCRAYTQGIVEIQDVASQAVVEMLPLRDGQRILDFCAGGGGKSLAMAARAKVDILAHDVHPQRMRDLPHRAQRAGVKIKVADGLPDPAKPVFDLVLVDAPCSGSGTWRRNPESKWALTPESLKAHSRLQFEILEQASRYVYADGVLAYATCSMFTEENQQVVERFLTENPVWSAKSQHFFSPLLGGDGLFVAVLVRSG